MKKSPYENKIEITVQAPDRGTEIFMVDSGLHRIASGVGIIKKSVSPGIYKVRFRSGESQMDKLIEVKSNMESLKIDGPSVQFSSAAPIDETSTDLEYHKKAAREISLSAAHGRPGRGSELFVFVRNLLPNASTEPWEGLSIHKIDGELLAKLSDGLCNTKEQCGGLNIEVDPGLYRIRVETGKLGTYEMFAVALSGWQTQYFALTEDFSTPDAQMRRASLRSSSILMAPRGKGFNPRSEYTRLAELFRIALQSGRNVLSGKDMIRFLKEKCNNPMLLIFGAHLLIRLRPINHELVDKVIGDFEQRFGIHPDVSALSLRPGAGTPASDLAFPEPPMLRSSWDLIVRGSRRRMRLVPPDSVSDKVAEGLLTTTPWLLHRLGQEDARYEPATNFSEGRRLLEKLVAIGEEKSELEKKEQRLQDIEKLNPLEQNILNATVLRPSFVEKTGRKAAMIGQPPSVDQVLSQIGAPNYAIARTAKSLIKKLGINFKK
jgi:hypothetical protein